MLHLQSAVLVKCWCEITIEVYCKLNRSSVLFMSALGRCSLWFLPVGRRCRWWWQFISTD